MNRPPRRISAPPLPVCSACAPFVVPGLNTYTAVPIFPWGFGHEKSPFLRRPRLLGVGRFPPEGGSATLGPRLSIQRLELCFTERLFGEQEPGAFIQGITRLLEDG